MAQTVQVLTHSQSSEGPELVTFQLRYQRFIHAEELTHRLLSTSPDMVEVTLPDGLMYDRNLSRNASSSRATPVRRLIEDVLQDPALPIYWGQEQRGMQARQELSVQDQGHAQDVWLKARDAAVDYALALQQLGAHKQLVNRLLEPFSHINVVVTATRDAWRSFFELRAHADAQPEIQALAYAMIDALDSSVPTLLVPGQWHRPYIREEDEDRVQKHYGRLAMDRVLNEISTARCARVSYLTHDQKPPELAADLKLFDQLMSARPWHASPSEHQATPDTKKAFGKPYQWQQPELHGNFVGWVQHRKLLEVGSKDHG